jgi:hypothetical protein
VNPRHHHRPRWVPRSAGTPWRPAQHGRSPPSDGDGDRDGDGEHCQGSTTTTMVTTVTTVTTVRVLTVSLLGRTLHHHRGAGSGQRRPDGVTRCDPGAGPAGWAPRVALRHQIRRWSVRTSLWAALWSSPWPPAGHAGSRGPGTAQGVTTEKAAHVEQRQMTQHREFHPACTGCTGGSRRGPA